MKCLLVFHAVLPKSAKSRFTSVTLKNRRDSANFAESRDRLNHHKNWEPFVSEFSNIWGWHVRFSRILSLHMEKILPAFIKFFSRSLAQVNHVSAHFLANRNEPSTFNSVLHGFLAYVFFFFRVYLSNKKISRTIKFYFFSKKRKQRSSFFSHRKLKPSI